MGIRIGIGSLKIGQGSTGVDWSSYWATLISATVETAAPTDVVLTFPSEGTSVATDITATVNGVARIVSSASWAGSVWTVVLASAVIYGDVVVVAFVPSGGTATVTNNVAADYYVRSDGSNTSPYNTPAKASTTLKTVLDYIQTNEDGSGCILSIGSGIFSSANDVMALDHANKKNITIIGAGRSLTTISPSSGNCINASNCDGAKIKRLSIKPGGATVYGYLTADTTDTVEFEDVDFIAPAGYNQRLVRNIGNTTNYLRCIWYHQYGAGSYNPVEMTGDSAGTFTNCISVSAGQTKSSQSWSIATSGNVSIINSNILDSAGWGIYFNGTGTFVVKNSIVSGGNDASTTYPIGRNNGNLTVSNTLLIANVWDGDAKWISGTYTDGGGNVFTSVNPKFTDYPRKGYILPRIDDSGNLAYSQSVEAILSSNSMTGSYFTEQSGWNTANNAALRTMVASGIMEVASHSYSHSALQLTGKLFDVTKDAETITIDRSAGTITLSGGGSVTGFKAKTLNAIKAELEGLGATVTGTSIFSATSATGKINGATLGEVIDDETASNVINLLIDNTGATGLFKTEITDPKTWLADTIINGAGDVVDGQTGAKYVCRSFGFPYNSSSVDARLAAIAANYSNASSGKIGGAGTIADIPYVGDIDMFAIVDVNASTYLAGTNEANTRFNARSLAFAAAHTGLVIGILAHNISELSLDQWTWAINEWSNYGNQLNVCSRQQFRDTIAGGDWTDDTDGTYSRTYVNGDADYTLDTGSPCISTGEGGVNIGASLV